MKNLYKKIIRFFWAGAVVPAGNDALQFLGESAKRGGLNPNPDTSPTSIISVIINATLGLVGVIFFIQMLLAGIRWLMAEGNEEIIKNSKNAIFSAIIGMTIIFSAFIITNFALNRLDALNK